MDKSEIVNQLNKQLAEVSELRKLSYSTNEFPRWKNSVQQILTQAYGLDSAQYKRFENAPGKFFKVDTELGRQQSYHYQLEAFESALKTLIQRAEIA